MDVHVVACDTLLTAFIYSHVLLLLNFCVRDFVLHMSIKSTWVLGEKPG